MSLSAWLLLGLTVWLLALTFAAARIVKALGGVMLLLDGRGAQQDVQEWGLISGSKLDTAGREALALDGERAIVILLSGSCSSCLAVSEELVRRGGPLFAHLRLVVSGPVGALDEAVRYLSKEVRLVTGQSADVAVDALGQPPLPFCFLVDQGTIVGKALLNDARNLERLTSSTWGIQLDESPEHSPAHI